MDDLLQTFGEEVSAIFRQPGVTLALQLALGYLVILWLAASYWTFRDLRSRTQNVFVPYLAAAGVLVLTPIGFPLALLAYRVVRPQETLAERRTRDLEAYVLTAEVARSACAACARPVEDEWMRCPACGSQLAVGCEACGGRVGPEWSVCAWCARDLEPIGEPAVEPPPPLPIPVAALVDVEPVAPEPRDPIPGWRADPLVGPAASTSRAPDWETGQVPEEVVGTRPEASDRWRRTDAPILVGGRSGLEPRPRP